MSSLPCVCILLILLVLVEVGYGTTNECGYFRYEYVATPIGSQFCSNYGYESWYFICSSDGIPLMYSFWRSDDCKGSPLNVSAVAYYSSLGYDTSYSCASTPCDYVYYDYYSDDGTRHSQYLVTDLCTPITLIVDSDTYNFYFYFECDAYDAYVHLFQDAPDCSGFPDSDESVAFSFSSIDAFVQECSHAYTMCGDTTVSKDFHIGDIVEDVVDFIDDVCNSPGGTALSSSLIYFGFACDSLVYLGAICDIFDIEHCSYLGLNEVDNIVANCWSSEAFEYTGITTKQAFGRRLSDQYGIDVTLVETTSVSGESYSQTEVYLDNCGSLSNYFIAGVYEVLDNAEQNDVVSDVVEYLVNRGIANADNPVAGVASTDQSVADGVNLTDVVRSKRGLLLHYDDQDSASTSYGIYLCEFNVVADTIDNGAPGIYDEVRLSVFLFVALFFMW